MLEADAAKVCGHEGVGVVVAALIVLVVVFLGVVVTVVVVFIADCISIAIDNLNTFRIFVKILTHSPAKRVCRSFFSIACAAHVSRYEVLPWHICMPFVIKMTIINLHLVKHRESVFLGPFARSHLLTGLTSSAISFEVSISAKVTASASAAHVSANKGDFLTVAIVQELKPIVTAFILDFCPSLTIRKTVPIVQESMISSAGFRFVRIACCTSWESVDAIFTEAVLKELISSAIGCYLGSR